MVGIQSSFQYFRQDGIFYERYTTMAFTSEAPHNSFWGFLDDTNILMLGAAEGRNIFEALASTRPASEGFKKLTLR